MQKSFRFQEILIRPEMFSLNGEKEIVALFNRTFSPGDARLEYKDGKLVLFLRQINIEDLQSLRKKDDPSGLLEEIYNAVISIKNYGVRNKKRVFIDFNKEKKVTNRKDKTEKRGMYFYARHHPFKKKNNSLPEKFENNIICGDSETVLKAFPDNSIDLVITSPPYNFGLNYDSEDDAKKWEKYFEKLFAVFDETIRVLKYGGRIIVNVQPLYSDYIPTHHIISNFFMKRKMIWRGEILWEKNNYNCKYTAWGSWKSPSSPYLKYTWEFLEIFSKGSIKHKGKKQDIDISAEEFKKWVIAKWNVAPEMKMKTYEHPAMFPEKLVEQALKLFSYRNDVILDPFNGVGTTTAVAKRLGRRYIGIDISEKYCEIARKRTSNTPIQNNLF